MFRLIIFTFIIFNIIVDKQVLAQVNNLSGNKNSEYQKVFLEGNNYTPTKIEFFRTVATNQGELVTITQNTVFKLNKNGQIVWQKLLGKQSQNVMLRDIEKTNSGVLIGGVAAGKPFVSEINQNGNVMWQKTIDASNGSLGSSPSVTDIVPTTNNSFHVYIGEIFGLFQTTEDIITATISSTGNLSNTKKYSTFPISSQSVVTIDTRSVEVENNNRVMAENLNNTIWVTKTDPVGTVLWSHLYSIDNQKFNSIRDIVYTKDKKILILGNESTGFGAERKSWLLALSTQGNVSYFKTYDAGNSGLTFTNIFQKKSRLVVSGTKDIGINSRAIVAVLNSNGAILKQHSYNYLGSIEDMDFNNEEFFAVGAAANPINFITNFVAMKTTSVNGTDVCNQLVTSQDLALAPAKNVSMSNQNLSTTDLTLVSSNSNITITDFDIKDLRQCPM